MSQPRIPFPWLSMVLVLLLICWQLIVAFPQWIEPWTVPPILARFEYLLVAVGLWAVLVIVEMRRFLLARSAYAEEFLRLEDQVAELFESRRQLGTRARTYSSHADKLKLFISDKLLEYIEYDEKFLHFKNIASEVRHNGVISYDRAQTALRRAAEICVERLDDPAEQQQFAEASAALTYLWDLLDIATTDNISLHVANRIYDCEEYYFQSQLNKSDPGLIPYAPTFTMFSALQKALLPVAEDPDQLRRIEQPPLPFDYLDKRFQLRMTGDTDLLGNRNHMVLLVENLVNNALYYADQKSSKKRYSRVTIQVSRRREQSGDEIRLEVYNRGPSIKDKDRDKIFQLGYSSRRIRDHHGKGLGLYFVNEICKGFEGSIGFDNIDNQENNLTLRIELTNGDIENRFVMLAMENGKPLCKASSSDPSSRSMEWSFSNPVRTIEVSTHDSAEPQIIDDLMGKDSFTFADSSEALLPRWTIDLHNRRRSARLVLRPIDVRGVRFLVRLPTASARLESQEGF